MAEIKLYKEESNYVRLDVRGCCLDFDGVTATQCAFLSTTKIIMNSTIYTLGAKFMTMDFKDFYYVKPMEEYEYMQILLSSIPQ